MAFTLASSTTIAPMMTLAAGSSASHIWGQVLSWMLAIVIVAAAVCMVLSRKLIHSALYLLFVMIGMAIEYAILQAPFVFVVQIVVYAGAIMVMFLFIVMMVGANADAGKGDPIPGQRIAAILMALAMIIITAVAVSLVTWPDPVGLDKATHSAGGNIPGLGQLIFNKYVIIFEVLSALLIVAAVGTIVLTLRTRSKKRPSQRETMEARFRAYAEKGTDVGAMPGAGVYAASNAMDVPALLPDSTELHSSISDEMYESREARSGQELAEQTQQHYKALDKHEGEDE